MFKISVRINWGLGLHIGSRLDPMRSKFKHFPFYCVFASQTSGTSEKAVVYNDVGFQGYWVLKVMEN